MIKEINMPMMTPEGGSSSSESELTWDDIPSAGPCDIQSGRNVYIELNEDETCTKASAGKILQFIKEGYMPVLKHKINNGPDLVTRWVNFTFSIASLGADDSQITVYQLTTTGPARFLYAFSDALDKPFTTIPRALGSGSGGF